MTTNNPYWYSHPCMIHSYNAPEVVSVTNRIWHKRWYALPRLGFCLFVLRLGFKRCCNRSAAFKATGTQPPAGRSQERMLVKVSNSRAKDTSAPQNSGVSTPVKIDDKICITKHCSGQVFMTVSCVAYKLIRKINQSSLKEKRCCVLWSSHIIIITILMTSSH